MHMESLSSRFVPSHSSNKRCRKCPQPLSLIQGGAKRNRDDFERKITSTSESAEPAAPLPGTLGSAPTLCHSLPAKTCPPSQDEVL